MMLIYCDRCEYFHSEEIHIPNKETGIADVYCEGCLPDEYKERWANFKSSLKDEEREFEDEDYEYDEDEDE